MIKIKLGMILSILIISFFSALAQDGVFLQVKDNLITELQGLGAMSTRASVNTDNTHLAITFDTQETQGGGVQAKIKVSHHAIVLDLRLGKVLSRVDGSTYQYIGDYLIRLDYANDGALVNVRDNRQVEKTYLIDPSNFSIIKELNLGADLPNGKGQFYVTHFDDNYMIVQYQIIKKMGMPTFYSTLYNYGEETGLEKIKRFDIVNATLSPDKTIILGSDPGMMASSISAYNIATGKEVFKQKTKGPAMTPKITAKGEIFYGTLKMETKGGMAMDMNNMTFKENTFATNLNNRKSLSELGRGGSMVGIDDEEKYLISVVSSTGAITLWDIATKQLLSETTETFFKRKKPGIQWNVSLPFPVNNGKQFLIGYSSGIVSLFSVKEQKVTANLFFDKEDWAVIAKDGRMNGTPGALEKLEWQEMQGGKVIAKTSLSASFNQAYTPNLFSMLLNDEITPAINLKEIVAQSPDVKILSPGHNLTSETKDVKVEIQAIPKGDPVSEIMLYVNGKLTGGDERGFKVAGQTKTFDITLAPGDNVLTAKAISSNGYESEFDQITVKYSGQSAEARLYILAVGIDLYKNTRYNLNYAEADVTAFIDNVQKSTSGIFKESEVKLITNANATKTNILTSLEEIKANVSEEDVFVFYYAGHGVMSEGTDLDPAEFYLALHDVTQLYGKDELLAEKGFSAIELRNAFSTVSAQKQLIVLDACQSGGAVESFARRGAAEEKAMLQLARSAGIVLMASTGSEQYATEFDELGHGVFTYALLEGLSGKADGGKADKKITVKELEAYMNDAVPELTEKYKGSMQFPRSWASGQDFPLVIVNE